MFFKKRKSLKDKDANKKKSVAKCNHDASGCNHDVNDEGCTLDLLPEIFLVYPPVYHMVCKNCLQTFEVRQSTIVDKKSFLGRYRTK